LASLAQDHTLTFFEFWYSDLIEKKKERAESLKILGMLDDFLAGILEHLDLSHSLLLVVSDHGNFEDWTTTKHTKNPSLTILAGEGFQALVPRLQSLEDIKPAILAYLLEEEGTYGN
jgi:phosphopentomutase